ncbi:hypothetical protein [Thiohalobacter sp.]|uniref:hypothetical protein n=1 Tax=Thiohalobacter sp. TaxID=2025948 RepID=UPI00262B2840|nr:hypothetical protein [Thiohalobacter sp.]
MPTSRITIKSTKSVDDFSELNRLTEALVVVDEIYRLMSRPEVIRQTRKIDFRRKEYKEIEGARLIGFRVSSPPEITIVVDNIWLGALAFVLVNYKTVKENLIEIFEDGTKILHGISGLTKNEIDNIKLGVKLFYDQLSELTSKDIERLESRIKKVRSKLSLESVKEIIAERDENT